LTRADDPHPPWQRADKRLLKSINTDLANVPLTAREKFDTYKDLLNAFGNEEMALRNSRHAVASEPSTHEDHERPEEILNDINLLMTITIYLRPRQAKLPFDAQQNLCIILAVMPYRFALPTHNGRIHKCILQYLASPPAASVSL
jgi:hypothetical protein